MCVMGNNITCAINCNHRIAATLYTLETCLFKVYEDIIINTLHKGGGDDVYNDDDDIIIIIIIIIMMMAMKTMMIPIIIKEG